VFTHSLSQILPANLTGQQFSKMDGCTGAPLISVGPREPTSTDMFSIVGPLLVLLKTGCEVCGHFYTCMKNGESRRKQDCTPFSEGIHVQIIEFTPVDRAGSAL